MNYDKPFKTFEEQIEHLKKIKKLNFRDERLAMTTLQAIPYYDLINGYKDIFMEKDSEFFRQDITFEYLTVFHHFNHTLQSVLFKYSVYAENIFKNNLAYIISKEFGVHQNEYLNLNCYINPKNKYKRKQRDKIISRIKKIASDCSDNPTKYYIENHNHIPPWILFKNITFGDSIELYKLLSSSHKKEIANLIFYFEIEDNQKSDTLISALTIIRKFRNKIAHNLKFVTYRTKDYFLKKECLPPQFLDTLLKDYTEYLNSPFAMIIALTLLIPSPALFLELVKDIHYVFSGFNRNKDLLEFYCKITQIPPDILDRLNLFSSAIEKGNLS